MELYRIISVVVLLGFALSGRVTMAQSNYVANIGIGNKLMAVQIGSRESRAQFTSMDASWSVINGNWFASMNLEQSLKDGLQFYNEDILQNGSKIGYANGVIIHTRTDASLTVGYRLFASTSLFAGYREGQTESYLSAIRKDNSAVEGISSHGKIKSRGMFAGLSVSHRFAGSSSLSASVAVAKLTGSASLAEPYVDTTSFQSDPSFPSDVKGDAVGFSYVMTWSNPISDRASLNLKAKIHRYHFEDQKVYKGVDLSYNENFTTSLLELTYRL